MIRPSSRPSATNRFVRSSPFPVAGLAGLGACLLIATLASPSRAEEAFTAFGVSTITDAPGQPFAVTSVTLTDAEGKTSRGATDASEIVLARDGRVLTATYPWGKVVCEYDFASDGRRVDVKVAVSNASDRTIHELRLTPLKLKVGADARLGRSHHNIGAPTVIPVRTSSAALAVCNEDIVKPLTLGVARPRDGVAAVEIRAGGDRMVYDELFVSRPIAPGGSDAYALSVRIGPAEADPHDLANDIYRAFAAAHPPKLSWPDRRPISRLFFGGGAPKEQIIAYFADPNGAPRPAGGNEKYRRAVLEKVRRGVEAAREINAQGIIFWDIEGSTFPHPTTYIGDPRLVEVMNPDFDAVADECFKMVADAGLLSGVCIRPTQIVYKKDANTVGHASTPVLRMDPERPVVSQLSKKIAYCKKRWGCRIYYVDTNFMWRPRGKDKKWAAGMIQAEDWKRILDQHPDVLIIPEFHYPEYLAYVAPYHEYDMGYRGRKPGERRMYPKGMFVPVIEDADPYVQYDLMVRNVREGDSLMTFAHSLTRNARAIIHLYTEAEILDAGPPEGLADASPEALANWLSAGDLREQFYAARALAEVPGPEAAKALRDAAAEEGKAFIVRKNAVIALGKRRDEKAIPMLVDHLSVSRPDLRYFAAEALGRIGKPALGPVRAALSDGEAMRFGITALGLIGDPKGAEILVDMLENKTAGRNQRELCAALGRIGGPAALAKLTEILNDPKAGFLRPAAAKALGEIGTPEAVERLKAARAAENAKPKKERFGHLVWTIGRVLNRID